jgi:dihydropteroate synthase-like protein
MARILIVTSRLAEPIVRSALSRVRTKHSVDVLVMPVQVAAFLNTNYVASYLKDLGVKNYDYILLPGLVSGSGKIVEEVVGIKTVKGPVNAYDLVDVLELDDLSILSSDEPADNVLVSIFIERGKEMLKRLEEKLVYGGSVLVGKLRVPINPPPIRVATEITEVHRLENNVLIEKVKKYIDNGADIVVLGFEALNPHPDEVVRAIKVIKKEFDIPVAVDTPIPSELNASLRHGVDMAVNIDLTNIDKIGYVDKDVAVVVIPTDPSTNSIPSNPMDRVEILEKTVNTVRSRGFEKMFADAILEPFLRTFSSLLAFYMFKRRNPSTPMFAGIGNVTELIDVDSVGINASMVMLCQEIGISIVLTVEKSVKAQGSTLETKIASQMASLAYVKNSHPKNLGLSLLILKDKRRYGEEFIEKPDVIVEAIEEDKPYILDPLGVFKIRVDHNLGCIEALYIGKKGRILIRGRTAKSIQNKILELGLVSQLSHAIYLGRELIKAEIALQLGKNYIQEMSLFTKPRFIKID